MFDIKILIQEKSTKSRSRTDFDPKGKELAEIFVYLGDSIDDEKLATFTLTTPFGEEVLDFGYDFISIYEFLPLLMEFLDDENKRDHFLFFYETNLSLDMVKTGNDSLTITFKENDRTKQEIVLKADLKLKIRTLIANFNMVVKESFPEIFHCDTFQSRWMNRVG